jgi:tRNA A-37 threonylcarbamoyl transferase component Bud32
MKSSEENSGHSHLLDVVDEMKEDIAKQLQLDVSQTGAPVITSRLLPRRAVHSLAALEIGNNGDAFRCFAKGNLPNYRGPQRLDVEDHILRHIAPKIWEANASARSPRVLAFFPDRELLILEMVDGETLKSLLFDVGITSSGVPNLLRLAGEWLGRLHALTRQGQGDPFLWLESSFAEKKVEKAFRDCSVGNLYPALSKLLQQFRRSYPDFVLPLCQLHGEFTPLHVLVSGNTIYVIDFGSSHAGFGYEDVAFFTTFYNGLLPWRAAAGSLRLSLRQQKNLFMESYFAHCGQTFGPADDVVMRFARLQAMAHHESCWELNRETWVASIYSGIGRRWVRRRFAALARQEFASLQRMATALSSVSHAG